MRRSADPQKQRLYSWEQKCIRILDATTPREKQVIRTITSRAYVLVRQPGQAWSSRATREYAQRIVATIPGATVEPYVRRKYARVLDSGGITLAQAQDFSDMVCSAFDRTGPRVTITKRLKVYSNYGHLGIRLAAGWGQSYTVLAHEVAHAVCSRLAWGVSDRRFEQHGPEFARVLCIILSRFVLLAGNPSEDELIAQARGARLEVADAGYPHLLASVACATERE